MSFSPDGALLATARYGRGVVLWDVATGASLGKIGNGDASDFDVSRDWALVAFARWRQGGAQVWDVAKRSKVATVEGDAEGDLTVALSPDGRMLAVGRFGRVVRLWDVPTGKLVHELDQGGAGAFALEFGGWPDPRYLRLRARRVPLGRCDRNPDRPAAHRR